MSSKTSSYFAFIPADTIDSPSGIDEYNVPDSFFDSFGGEDCGILDESEDVTNKIIIIGKENFAHSEQKVPAYRSTKKRTPLKTKARKEYCTWKSVPNEN
jgi:hypothetical protein